MQRRRKGREEGIGDAPSSSPLLSEHFPPATQSTLYLYYEQGHHTTTRSTPTQLHRYRFTTAGVLNPVLAEPRQ